MRDLVRGLRIYPLNGENTSRFLSAAFPAKPAGMGADSHKSNLSIFNQTKR